MIYLQLFLSFVQIGMFSIGGGYAAVPLIRNQTVIIHSWLTMSEFTDLVTIAEMTPGPIALNAATFIGIRVAGIPGAIAATISCILPSILIVSLLSFIYTRYRKLSLLQSILACLRPAVVALIAAAGFSILRSSVLSGSSIDVPVAALFIAALCALSIFKKNPIVIMFLCGIIYTGFALVTGTG